MMRPHSKRWVIAFFEAKPPVAVSSFFQVTPFQNKPNLTILVLFTTLRLIINQIHAIAPFNSTRLSKYIRCLFQAILPLDVPLALQLIDQAIKIAHDGCDVGAPLPRVEMEWLVASTFNQAVDFYSMAREDECGLWALKAIELAGWMDDGGELRGVLEGKFAKLKFEAK